jgi:hypothetical protein
LGAGLFDFGQLLPAIVDASIDRLEQFESDAVYSILLSRAGMAEFSLVIGMAVVIPNDDRDPNASLRIGSAQ